MTKSNPVELSSINQSIKSQASVKIIRSVGGRYLLPISFIIGQRWTTISHETILPTTWDPSKKLSIEI
ncbi:hypothetical protein ES705_50042 [subsurface metagenome]